MSEYLQFLVLDEADRLFEACFTEPMRTILDVLPPASRRQTLLFSATLNDSFKELSSLSLANPCFIEVLAVYTA